MTTTAVHQLLEDLADTRELVVRAEDAADAAEPLLAGWRAAAAGERGAYAYWCAVPGRGPHALYLAAADQADAALASLTGAAGERAGPHSVRALRG